MCDPQYQQIHLQTPDTSPLGVIVHGIMKRALTHRHNFIGESGQKSSEIARKYIGERRIDYRSQGNGFGDGSPANKKRRTNDPVPGFNHAFRMKDGVVAVVEVQGEHVVEGDFPYKSLNQFLQAYQELLRANSYIELRDYCERRLKFLGLRYEAHVVLNGDKEEGEERATFYDFKKINNHEHAAACPTKVDVVSYVKRTLKDPVESQKLAYRRNEIDLTFQQVFAQSGIINPESMTVEDLRCNADESCRNNFKNFEKKFNLVNNDDPMVRNVLMRHVGNLCDGTHFANLIKGAIIRASQCNAQLEIRLPIRGKNREEWEVLANWARANDLIRPDLRILIQIKRNFGSDKNMTFEDLLGNIFIPVFEAARDRSKIALRQFIEHVTGFDIVGDEAIEEPMDPDALLMPIQISKRELPNWYWSYFIYANVTVLNKYRWSQGLGPMTFRPHSGETGPVEHLVSSFLLSESIQHGVTLKQSPFLQFLYYLGEVPISMAPTSNLALYSEQNQYPLADYRSVGMKIALGTDDSLIFHQTENSLVEEFAAATILSSVDKAEVSRNSVMMSGYPAEDKLNWLGDTFKINDWHSNNPLSSGCPNIRLHYRYKTLCQEYESLRFLYHDD